MFATGLVLAAGSSRRLGRPKQLLPYRGTTLLSATLKTARECAFDELIVTLGGAAREIRRQIDFSDVRVVEISDFGTGCASSVRSALPVVASQSEGVVLLLGDQPGIRPSSARALLAQAAGSPIGVCRYADGIGHPFWFQRSVFADLQALHGDKAVWKLLESGRHQVTEVEVDGRVPVDVDTEADYQSLLAADRGERAEQEI